MADRSTNQFPMTGSLRRTVRFALATMVTTSLLIAAGAPSVHAGSASDPEIQDAAEDVSPATFASNFTSDEETLFDDAGAYDVVKSWIGAESATHFMLFIEVNDLPDTWALPESPPPQSPFGENVSFAGTSLLANFTIAGHYYWAVAKLAHPSEGTLLDNYTLWRDGHFARSVSGGYSVTQDLLFMRLPKAAFLGLADAVKLEKFWVQGRFGNLSMDFAPNARDPARPSVENPPDPLQLSQLVASGRLVSPQFGRDYVFGQYYRGPGGGSNQGPAAPNLILLIQGAAQKTIAAGESAEYEVYVQNIAAAADTVYLTLNGASAGWDHSIEEQSLVLQPQASRLLILRVDSAEGASLPMRSVVEASSQLGASKSVSVWTLLSGSALGSPGPSPGDDGELPVIPAPTKADGAPGLAAAAILVVVTFAAFVIRRSSK